MDAYDTRLRHKSVCEERADYLHEPMHIEAVVSKTQELITVWTRVAPAHDATLAKEHAMLQS